MTVAREGAREGGMSRTPPFTSVFPPSLSHPSLIVRAAMVMNQPRAPPSLALRG